MRYPNVFRRYLATLLDFVVLGAAVMAAAKAPLVAASTGVLPAFAFSLVLVYEPLFTSYFCTAGQALMGIRVRTRESLQRIAPLKAYQRLLVKYVLGGISLLTIPAREDRRAIHDLATDTIVIDAR